MDRTYFHITVPFHNDTLSGHQFFHLCYRQIENRLNNRTLGSNDDHLIAGIIKSRPDSMRIPESEKIPASQQTGNDISSVPACRSFLQNMFDIDILFDRIVHRLTGQALGLESPVEVFHLIIQ